MVRLVLLRLSESYFRHRWLYLIPLVLMLTLAAYSFLTATPVYISRGVLYVSRESFLASLTSIQDIGFTWLTPAQITVDEFSELLQTDAFVRSIVLRTDLEDRMSRGPASVAETIAHAREALWVQTLGNNLALVGAADEWPQLTQQLVNAAIEAYIQWQIQSDREGSAAAQAFFAGLIKTYQSDLDLARQEMETYLIQNPLPLKGDRPESETLQIEQRQADMDLASSRLANALDKEEEARLALAQAESNARQTSLILDAPPLPTVSERSTKTELINSLVYLVVGVVLSVVGVVGGALLDRSVRFPIDVRHGLDLAVLASVPAPTARRRQRSRPARRAGLAAGKESA
jgi:capsular polysaccharide biosynthesis protein